MGKLNEITDGDFDNEVIKSDQPVLVDFFATKFPEVSTAMADRKLDSALEAGVEHLVSADPGCLLHLAGRHERRHTEGARPLHVAAHSGHEGVLKLLLESGAKVEAAGAQGDGA